MRRFADEVNALLWTVAGTGLVLITLSGDTRKWGVVISVAALAVHLVVALIAPRDEE